MMLRTVKCMLALSVSLFRIDAAQADEFAALRRDKLVAWCVAHTWDAANRTPAERAELLESLGIKRLAYNWRKQDNPDFEAEILQCREHGIEFFAFWNDHEEAFALFKQYGLNPQIWKICPSPKQDKQGDRIRAAANRLQPLVERAREMGSKLGIYNHGNWGGHPTNMVAVCEELERRGFDNVGIVFNFHHAHGFIDEFEEYLELMKSRLLCLNLNGMAEPESVNPETKENKILPIGAGVHEEEMIRIVMESGYDGPIGILGHLPDQDVEKSLRDNLEGLDQMMSEPGPQAAVDLFAKENLMAWCIVPYDSRQRTPQERAVMLKELGIPRLVWDWRDEHLPILGNEIRAAREHGIDLEAIWLRIEEPEYTGSFGEKVDFIIKTVGEAGLATDYWVMFGGRYLNQKEGDERVAFAADAVGRLADVAAKQGGRVALYNHGGWFGNPDNQIKIIHRAARDNIGIAYNFHHAHDEIDGFPALLDRMLPYLYAVNLNGMNPDGPKILTIGEGEAELQMLQALKDSGYSGPIGILGHIAEADAREVLQANLDGLEKLKAQLK